MLKLLVILNMQGSLVIYGKQERPQRIKRGKVFKRELWITSFIGQGYRMQRERRVSTHHPACTFAEGT